MLCKAVKEVRVTVNYIPPSTKSQGLPDLLEEQPSDVSILIPPIKTQVVGEKLDLGTQRLNTIAKNLGHVIIDFSHMPLYEVYAMQNYVDAKMKV